MAAGANLVRLSANDMQGLGLRGVFTPTEWRLPDDMGQDEWLYAGALLGKLDRSLSWWIGDWWVYAKKWEYGERKAVLDKKDKNGKRLWQGPSFEACMNAARVCRKFETSCRHEVLTFGHHHEVAGLQPEEREELLLWCEARREQPKGEADRMLGWLDQQPSDDDDKIVEVSTRELRLVVQELNNTIRISGIAQEALSFPSEERRYPIIYADPPWRYENPPMGGSNRSVENHYPTMSLEDICAFPVQDDLATENAMLYLWATAPKLEECFKVVKAWGFTYRTNIVWVKDKIGMGYHARSQHELLLIAKRGELPPPPASERISSVIFAPRTEHSRKPDEFYEYIESSYPALPKIELFARNTREGWNVWGNDPRLAA